MGNQPGQQGDDDNHCRSVSDLSNSAPSNGELARTQGGREVVEKHREFERQLEALRGSSAPRLEPPVPMHGPQAQNSEEDATPEEQAKERSSFQLSAEQTEIAAKAAAEAVIRLCPTGSEAEKRRALASIRNTRDALAEMPPFEVSALRPVRRQKSAEACEESGDHAHLDEDAPEEEVKTLTFEEGAFLPLSGFSLRRNRVLCGGLTCEQLRKPCEILGYNGPACCSDTTSSFAVGYEEPEDFRRQAMATASTARKSSRTLPPAIPEEPIVEAGVQHSSLMATSFQSFQENARRLGPPDLAPSPHSFSARSDVQETLARAEHARLQTGLVRTSSSSSAPGLGLQPNSSSFRELRGGLSSARAVPQPPAMPLAVALAQSNPLVRQASHSSSFSAPGQLDHISRTSPASLRHPPPPRTPSGASLPTPARSPINSPRGACASPLLASKSVHSFRSSPQHSFAQQSFVITPMSPR